MPLPRVRFTMRRMMIAVAIAGLISGGAAIGRRWQSLRARAVYHATEEWRMRTLVRGGFLHETDAAGRRKRREVNDGADRERARELVLYHALMNDRYQRAARRPWLSVPTDPPEPE